MSLEDFGVVLLLGGVVSFFVVTIKSLLLPCCFFTVFSFYSSSVYCQINTSAVFLDARNNA